MHKYTVVECTNSHIKKIILNSSNYRFKSRIMASRGQIHNENYQDKEEDVHGKKMLSKIGNP